MEDDHIEMDDKETETEMAQNSEKEESIKATESLAEVVKTTETVSDVNNSTPAESENLAEAGEKLEALAEGSDPSAKPSQPDSTETKTPKSLKSKPKIVKKKSAVANGPKNIANKGKAIQRNKKKVNKVVSQGSRSRNNEDGSSKISSDQQAERNKEKVTEPEKSQKDLEKGEKSGVEKESQNDKVVGNEEQNEKSPDKEKRGESAKRRRRSGKGKKPGGTENKKTDTETKKTDTPLKKKEKTDGLIFLCSKKTKPDCFRYRVMGVSIGNKETVLGIKRGMKLFLYDFDKKLMYGVYKATGSGGVKLEPKAFGGNFPAQVRFEVHKDCLPLPEAVFKKAIKENYNDRNKFKTELTSPQVKKLMSLFRPAEPHTSVVTAHDNKNNDKAAVTRDKGSTKEEKKEPHSHSRREERDRDSYRIGDSGSHRERDHDRGPRKSRWDSSPRKNLFLSEKEYRTFGLRGENRIPTPPPPPLPLPSDPYRRDYERERDPLLRHPVVFPVERDYRHHHDYGLGSAPAPGLNPYPSDPYYSRYYGISTVDSYPPPPRRDDVRREDIHTGSSLYSRRESYLLENESLTRREDSDPLRRREDSDSLRRREIEHLERLYSTYGSESAPSYQSTYNAPRPEDLPASSRYRDAPSYLYR